MKMLAFAVGVVVGVNVTLFAFWALYSDAKEETRVKMVDVEAKINAARDGERVSF